MSEKPSSRDMQKELYKGRIVTILSRHVGITRAIGMGELYSQVYGKSWKNRINDTRGMRYLITELRDEGVPVCSIVAPNGGGYYLASTSGELDNWLGRDHRKALRILAREAKIRRTTLPELLGQMHLNMTEVAP